MNTDMKIYRGLILALLALNVFLLGVIAHQDKSLETWKATAKAAVQSELRAGGIIIDLRQRLDEALSHCVEK